MTTPGFFQLFSEARPPLPAGSYTTSGSQALIATPPHADPVTVPIDDTQFHFDIVGPRFTMPPDQILSTYPPATFEGDLRTRLPQIVLKRRTLPWERNPDPASDPQTAPPWLALVVLADGEGRASAQVAVSQCVTPGVMLDDEADVATGTYLEVTKPVIDAVFPTLDELPLLCHVRRVDLRDTELALGDDDGYLAVVLANRLPQPAVPASDQAPATPQKYTAYLINLEGQLAALLPSEPTPKPFYDTLISTDLVDPALLVRAPEGTVDQVAMGLGAVREQVGVALSRELTATAAGPLASFDTARGVERSAGAWATGPAKNVPTTSRDLATAAQFKTGVLTGQLEAIVQSFRFPVLVSWSFTCTGAGDFEQLMHAVDVGLLGTVDPAAPPPGLEIAPTGHIALAHRTRYGESNTTWFRGPLTPQPTSRVQAQDGVLPLAAVADQLRKVVPDGREDISLAALFEIGRLLTLNKPMLVAALMAWRGDLFGAARARELADALAGPAANGIGLSAAGGRNALEGLLRTNVVGTLAGLPANALAPPAQQVTAARLPAELAQFGARQLLTGLGVDPQLLLGTAASTGVDGLGAPVVPIGQASTAPAVQDQAAIAALTRTLAGRVDALMRSTVPDVAVPRTGLLDRLIADAERRRTEGG